MAPAAAMLCLRLGLAAGLAGRVAAVVRGAGRRHGAGLVDGTLALQVEWRRGEGGEVAPMSRREALAQTPAPTRAPIYTLPRSDGEDAGVARQWSLVLADDVTIDELALISGEFPDGQHTTPSRGQIPLVAGSLTEEALDAVLEKYPGRVRFVEEDQYQLKVQDGLSSTPRSSTWPARKAETLAYPWGIQYVEADECRGKGKGVHVYVLDTGIRITHSEFGGRAFAGVDVAASGTYPGTLTVCSPFSNTCAADAHGHGSHCAGTVGASTYGVADGASIWAMKVLDNSGSGWTTWSILAEQWILASGNRPAVVSISIQANYNSYAEQASIDSLVAVGVTVVVAAGNYNQDACKWNPAWIPSAITVAAFGGTSGNSWDRSGYSNWGSCIDTYAPGTNILSTGPWSDTHTYSNSGTSMACPHVSGLAARMYEAYPTAGSLSAAARWSLLTATSCFGCVTNDATPIPTVNLVIKALSCNASDLTATPTASPTRSPTLLPTVSPTPSPTTAPTADKTRNPTPAPTDEEHATDDPHLVSLSGQKFDVNMPGSYVLIRAPEDQRRPAKLQLNASVRPFAGSPCGLYIQGVELSGEWLGDQVVRVVPLRRDVEGSNGAGNSTLRPFSVRVQSRRGDESTPAGEYQQWKGLRREGSGLSGRVRLVPVWRHVYADAGRAQEAEAFQFRIRGAGAGYDATLEVSQAAHQALNFRATNLRSLGFAELGGLLGTEAHDPTVEHVSDMCRAFRSKPSRLARRNRGALEELGGPSMAASWA